LAVQTEIYDRPPLRDGAGLDTARSPAVVPGKSTAVSWPKPVPVTGADQLVPSLTGGREASDDRRDLAVGVVRTDDSSAGLRR
jgi:hypothetical protein